MELMEPPVEEMFSMIMDMMGGFLAISVLGLASSLLLAFCVYYDAKARGNSNAVVWAILSGFFNIAALVYIIAQAVSKPKPVYCMRCGNIVPPGFYACPVCNTPVTSAAEALTPEQIAQYKKIRLILFIVWIVVTVITTILSMVIVMEFVRQIFSWASEYSSGFMM